MHAFSNGTLFLVQRCIDTLSTDGDTVTRCLCDRGSRPTTTDCPVCGTTSCTGRAWTFLSGCNSSCVQRSIDVYSKRHHASYMTDCCIRTSDVVRRQRHLRSAGCHAPAARAAPSALDVRPSGLLCGRLGGLEFTTELSSSSIRSFDSFRRSLKTSFLVLLA